MAAFLLNSATDTARTLFAGERGTLGSLGVISPVSGSAVSMLGTGAVLFNYGAIFSREEAVLVDGGIAFVSISNAGTIAGEFGAIFSTEASLNVTNSGTLHGLGDTGDGIYAGNRLQLTNSGEILSNSDTAIEIRAASGTSRIVNTGVIASSFEDLVISSGAGVELIRNTGTILGNVSLGAGDDIFDTIGGTFTGTVFGSLGNDTYRISNAALTILENTGSGSGIDVVESTVDYALTANVETLLLLASARDGIGNASANLITGNAAANRLLGQAGNDTLAGLIGNDTLLGGTGNDSLSAGDGSDNMQGEDGDDALSGGVGADTLLGGAGNDFLNGGGGADQLSGGIGADRFDFNSTFESYAGGADRITSFTRGQDRVDLVTIDARVNVSGQQGFTFIGAAAFTNTGQVRIVDQGADVRIEANTSNTAGAELTILVSGVGTMTAGDFIL